MTVPRDGLARSTPWRATHGSRHCHIQAFGQGRSGAAIVSAQEAVRGSPITPNNERLIEARRILDGLPEEESDEVEALPEIHFRVEDKDWGDAAATRVQAAVRGRKARQSRDSLRLSRDSMATATVQAEARPPSVKSNVPNPLKLQLMQTPTGGLTPFGSPEASPRGRAKAPSPPTVPDSPILDQPLPASRGRPANTSPPPVTRSTRSRGSRGSRRGGKTPPPPPSTAEFPPPSPSRPSTPSSPTEQMRFPFVEATDNEIRATTADSKINWSKPSTPGEPHYWMRPNPLQSSMTVLEPRGVHQAAVHPISPYSKRAAERASLSRGLGGLGSAGDVDYNIAPFDDGGTGISWRRLGNRARDPARSRPTLRVSKFRPHQLFQSEAAGRRRMART